MKKDEFGLSQAMTPEHRQALERELVSTAMKILNERKMNKYGPVWRRENAIHASKVRWDKYFREHPDKVPPVVRKMKTDKI